MADKYPENRRELGFKEIDPGAPNIAVVLHERAKRKDLEQARELLQWSRTLEDHGLCFEAWKKLYC